MNKMSSEKSNVAGNSVDSVNSVEESDSDRINKMDKMASKNSKSSAAGNSKHSVHSVKESDSDRINKVDKMVSEGSDTSNSVDSVHSVRKSLPNSKKIYVAGKLHPDLRVPFREISLAPTKTMTGEIEINEPVRVYDTSGPWGDPSVTLDPIQGLPPLRRDWISSRRDTDEITGRIPSPLDDGYLSEVHRATANGRDESKKDELRIKNFRSNRKPLRASAGHPVTQLWYAQQGIITPEMEFIAIRENHRIASKKDELRIKKDGNVARNHLHNSSFLNHTFARNHLAHQHQGDSFGAAIQEEITREFVRSEVARV